MAVLIPFTTDFLGLETPVFIALLIGPIQLTSSALSVLREAPLSKFKTIHLALSIGFFIVYILGLNLGLIVEKSVYHLIFPFMLAVFYYSLTLRWLLMKEQRHALRRMPR